MCRFYDKRFVRVECIVLMAVAIFLLVCNGTSYADSIRSPDGRYEAKKVASGKDVHYQVREISAGRIIFNTYAEFPTPNDVKAGLFSPNSRMFAAAYHYGHDGKYTWIGIWDIEKGKIIRTKRKAGWVRNLSGIFTE